MCVLVTLIDVKSGLLIVFDATSGLNPDTLAANCEV